MTHESKHLFIAATVVALVLAAAGAQAAAADLAASRLATQPGKPKPPARAPLRVKLLKANPDSFALHLSYLAVKKEQSTGASFSTLKPSAPMAKGDRRGVRISKAQAAAIIDHLDKSGVLARLLDPQTLAIVDMQIPTPHLHVKVIAGKHSFENWLPINPKAVDLVEALDKLLDGDAAKAMDKLLAALPPDPTYELAGVKALIKLPGSRLAVAQALKHGFAFVVACKAWSPERYAKDPNGDRAVSQAFRPPAKVLAGRIDPKIKALNLTYHVRILSATIERPVRTNERVIWIVRKDAKNGLRGVKALSDTPENRAAVIKAVKTAERTEMLKKKVDEFALVIAYFGPRDSEKPFLSAVLSVPELPRPDLVGPHHWRAVQISKSQASKIIDHLASEGFLARATDVQGKTVTYPKGPAYVLKITRRDLFYRDLGWDLKMLKRLDALRKVLEGDAAKAMDKLLKALDPQRKKWQKAAAGKPAAKPPVKWGKEVNGLVCGISAFKKSVQVGVPYQIEVSIKNISKGDILLLKQQLEAGKEPLHDHVYFMRAGTTYREFFVHYLKGNFTGGPVRRQDFVLLRPGDIYKFTHGTLVYTGSITNDLKKGKGGLGLMGVTLEGTYQMQVRYQPWFTLAKGADLGGLKPWKGVLLSAPVEVVVGKDPAKSAVKWGKAANGLICGISAFKPNVQLGVPYQIEVSIKNVSTKDIGFFKTMLGNGDDRIILTRAGEQYRERYTIDSKAMKHAAVSPKDLVRLKPKDIYKFTHRTLIYPRSMAKKFWKIEVGLGHMAVSREGAHQMHVKYEPRDLRIAKGTDLGGLKPWKGVLLSAPVEVIVPKAEAKRKAS